MSLSSTVLVLSCFLCVLCVFVVESPSRRAAAGHQAAHRRRRPRRQDGRRHPQVPDRELAASAEKRDAALEAGPLVAGGATRSRVEPNRERLRKILGVVDERVPPKLEYVGGPGEPSLVAETDGYKVHAVRWPVLPGVDGEGLLLEPKGKPRRTSSRSRTPTRRRRCSPAWPRRAGERSSPAGWPRTAAACWSRR